MMLLKAKQWYPAQKLCGESSPEVPPTDTAAIQWKVFNPGMFSLQTLQKGLLHNFRTELSIMGLGFYFRFMFDVLESGHLLSPLRKQYLRISEWTIREVNSNLFQ